MPAPKVCYYELLGIDRKAEGEEIKKVYRKLALKFHPDKAHGNNMSVEEATNKFQVIQEAYSVLSDPQERAWYDSHREQILKGQDDGQTAEDPFKTRINLYKYFSASCFSGFSDAEGAFYCVYNDLFAAIDHEEAEWEDLDSGEEHRAMPCLGRSDSTAASVSTFYRQWLDFCSRKAFGHADKWNPKDAPTRQVRRAMDAENKKARQASKKEFNAEVRQLVKFVQKRDPRVLAHQKQQMKDNVEKKQRETAEKEQKKSQEAAERKERLQAQQKADEERWAEAEVDRQARRERGEAVTEDEDSEEEEDEPLFVCEPCKKRFQNEKTFDQHCKTKKHLQVVASFRKELEKEMRQEAKKQQQEEAAAKALAAAAREAGESEDDEDEASSSSSSSSAPPPQAKQKAKAKAKATASVATKENESDESDDDDEDEDAAEEFLARMAAKKARGEGQDLEAEEQDDVGDDDDDDDEAAASSGRGGGRSGRGGRGGRGARGGFAPPPRGSEEAADEAAGGGSSSSSSGASDGEAGQEEGGGAGSKQGAGTRGKPKSRLQGARPLASSLPQLDEEGGRKAKKRAQLIALQQAVLEKSKRTALVEGVRKAQKDLKKVEAEGTAAAADASGAAGDAGGGGDERCGVCGEAFSSRSKLFQHIKEKGHATLKPMAGAPLEAAKSSKGKKKR